MIYRMRDGKIFLASTPKEFVRKMRNTSFIPSKNLTEYMDQVSKRIYIAHGVKLEYTDEKTFVDELIKHGIVRVETTQ